VLLLISLALMVFNPEFSWTRNGSQHVIGFDLRLVGGLLMFLVLILEVADRGGNEAGPADCTRDPDVAAAGESSAGAWDGDCVCYTSANTVAGDYYDVFPRLGQASVEQALTERVSTEQSYLIAVADVAGKSIPAALLMATFQASLKTLSATPSSLGELVGGMNRMHAAIARAVCGSPRRLSRSTSRTSGR